MIDLHARVEIPHANLTGRVIGHHAVPNAGLLYRVLLETDDDSHVERLFRASLVRVAISEPAGAVVVAMPRRLRVVVRDGERVG